MKENHILIGLGGTGGKILKAFRKRMFQEYSEDERNKLPIGYVYVDSIMEMMDPMDITWRVLGQNACFNNNEFVFIKGVEPDAVLRNPSGYPGLKGFIGDPEVMGKALGQVGAAAAQKRRAGRILFGSSVDSYKKTLTQQYNKVNQISGATRTNIHIFTGLAGGTGSGSIIDVIAQTRMMDQFRKGLDNEGKFGTNIVVYCMVPEVTPPGTSDAGRYHANGYAALVELNALQVKKYLPHDVSGFSDRLDLNEVGEVADGIILYSNVNEHGKIIDSFKQLPQIVSDFAYNRIFLESNENTEEFIRAYSFENINDWKIENNEVAKKDKVDPVRKKTFSSFGIKRIIIPEEEIIDYFTYSFGEQALLQMRYNNWNDDLGFRNSPAKIDFFSFVKEAENLQRWRLTDKHLILDQAILTDDDKKWNEIANYWNGVVPMWTEQARTNKMPLNELERFCNEGYEKFFRKIGVKDFYEGKLQVKELHATEICGFVEQYLFDKWSVGDFSLYNLLELMDRIIEFANLKRSEAEANITKWNQSIDQITKARDLNKLEYANAGIITLPLIKNRLIQGHSTIMLQLCIKKTELEGWKFAHNMLASLLSQLNTLKSRLEKFVGIISNAIDETEKQLGSRCNDQGNITDLKETTIRFYDKDAVVKFTHNVVKNKKKQEGVANDFRQEVIKLIGNDHTFARANATVTTDEISRVLDTIIRDKAIIIHDEILQEDSEKLINRNILEQLSERYRTEDELRTFATSVIEQSGVFLTFNDNETRRAVPNNPNPVQALNIMRKIVFVSLPKVEGNEQVIKFADKLKNALISAVRGGIEVRVDMNGERKNEMTIATINYCFPIRVLENLTFYKQKYDYLCGKSGDAHQNRIVLHTEGTGEDFPILFVEDDMPPSVIREKFAPYLVAIYSMGQIKYADKADGSGKSAYGTIEKTRLGREVLSPIAEKFTGIVYAATFDKPFGEGLKENFDKHIKTDYLHVSKREELVKEIQTLYGDIILPELGGNEGSSEGVFWANACEQAMDLIEKA